MATAEQTLTVLERQRQALVDAYIRRAWAMWRSMDPADWWNDAVTQGVGAWITQNQIAFVKAMRRLGISYADIMLRMVGTSPDGQIPEYVLTRANTDPWAVSVRPADAYRHEAVKDPTVRPEAWDRLDADVKRSVDRWLEAAMDRLDDNAETDGQIALNGAATERFHGSGIRSYRRVIHPELSKTGTCGLCVVASNNVYSTADLIPMHANCRCTVAPITAGHDPGLSLNGRDLARIYRAANNSTSAADLKQLRVEVGEHGEIGPILTQGVWRNMYDDGTPAPKWERPDRDMTRAAFRRMYERATEFQKRYREVLDTGRDVHFPFEGRQYVFKPSGHIQQAIRYQTAWLQSLRSTLGEAA